jgi:RNA polymerase sigma-70 factor (ECF subfamily)
MTWEQEQEVEWVIAAQAGDLRAFDQLAKRYRPGLIALAGQRLCRDLAEDVAQEALLIAFKALPGLQSPERFRSWLAAITRNLATRHSIRSKTTPLDDVIVAYAPSIVENLDLSVRSQQIVQAIQDCGPDLRPALELYYVHEWSIADISEFLGIPSTTVKWRLHTGRTQLRRKFDYLLED